MSNHTLTLIGRAGCHLCDEARAVTESVLTSMRDLPGTRDLIEVDIDSDADAHRDYWDQIPVLLVDGRVHNFWKIDAQRLERALA